MIDQETRAQIRHLFYAEHWKIGTITRELGLHPETVNAAVETDRFNGTKTPRNAADPYADFIREILTKHPHLRATRIYQMIRDRGFNGSVVQLRRFIARIRPTPREAFLRLSTFPAEQGQVDWAHFGEVPVGRARRRLSCFVITLSYSRVLYLEFFFDQRMESFLRGHIHAFEDWHGIPRVLLYDNLRSVVLEGHGDAIHFHPRLLELSAHYHFAARPCQVRAGNQKGKTERFWRTLRAHVVDRLDTKTVTTLDELNLRIWSYVESEYHGRPHASLSGKTPLEVWESDAADIRWITDYSQFEQAFYGEVERLARNDSTVQWRATCYEVPPYLCGTKVRLRYSLLDTNRVSLLDAHVEIPLRIVDPVGNAHRHRNVSKPEPEEKPNTGLNAPDLILEKMIHPDPTQAPTGEAADEETPEGGDDHE